MGSKGWGQVAGDDGKGFVFGVFGEICFFAIGKRAVDDVPAVIAQQFWRHGFEFAAVEPILKQCLGLTLFCKKI